MPRHSYLTVTDQFCGAGGSSIGAVAAGVELKLALNHWELAIQTHNSNFPEADHDCTDISACDPRRYPSTDILITSPECTNHSLAKGKKRKYQQQMDLFGKVKIDPAEERSRATMWDVPRFAEYHRYNIIIVENVVDARHWALWDAWLHAMRLLDYEHHIVYYNSMHAHPTPQSRDRMYVVFWRQGNRRPDLDIRPAAMCHCCGHDIDAVQCWKSRRWGRYRKQYIYCCPGCAGEVEPYYYCAANAIDWSLNAPRIGDRVKPLKEKTLQRIQAGLDKFSRQPFLFDTVHTARNGRDQDMAWSITQPNRTQIGQSSHGVIVPPYTVNLAYTHSESDRTRAITGPMITQTSWQTVGLVTPPYLVDLRGENAPKAITDAVSTVCASGNHHGLVMPFLTSYYGTGHNTPVDQCVPTVTTLDRHALLQPNESPSIEDCGFRMLQPHEIQAAMAFPGEYVVLGNKRERVKQLGNAVTPPVMKMLLERCIGSLS